MKIGIIFPVVVIAAACACCKSNKTVISSPDRQIRIVLHAQTKSGKPEFILETGAGKEILRAVPELSCKSRIVYDDPGFIKAETRSISHTWENEFGEKRLVPDNYNETTIFLVNGGIRLNLIIRVYNEGAAFAYEFPPQQGLDSLHIVDENILYSFKSDHFTWSAPRAQALYSHVPLSGIDKGCERPLVIEIDSSHVIALAEAGQVDYARMKFDPDSTGEFNIRSRLDGEVKKSLPFRSPWRIVMFGKNAGDLLEKNYLILNLNDPCNIGNTEWIRPGKALREVTLTTTGAMALVDFIDRHN
ncbi:MAG: glycoside hydrolase family 97 N-terminal domain-containing protein, partial [Bacteroidales bacterium]|nr:glycoside hydrolase family 97 N-terminal domain-containing protein [Bacteroidales bacterium]